jgi:exosome complex exonuclease RRP6
MDVIWLQRDLGLYLVGVFDTEHAASALHYPKRSLAFLLEKHVNFTAQKQYQLADWRVRPLSKELFDYARSDTHFLLYVFDCLRNELVENSHDGEDGDLIARVLRESKRYQMQRYENPFYDSENGLGSMGWYKQLFRAPALLSKQQFAVFKAVHQWRDNLARAEDESLFFVMSNHLLQTIAREMPVTKEALLAVTPQYSALVRANADRLISVIAEAKDRGGREGLEMREQMAKSDQLADEQHNNKWAVRKHQELEQKIKAKIARAEEEASKTVEAVDAPKRAGIVDVKAVKAEGSAFWGSTLGGLEQRRSIHSDVKLSLPMPEVSGDVFLSTNGATPVKIEATLPSPVSPTQMDVDTRSQEEASDVFVLREKSRSKKRKAQDVGVHDGDELKAGADEVEIDVDDGGEEAQRQLRRNQRKAKKEEKKRRRAQESTSRPAASSFQAKPKEEAEAEEPFDYANAPSVLASGGAGVGDKKKKRKKGRMEGLDPYKKALDTGKGVPRGQRERVGQGATFSK